MVRREITAPDGRKAVFIVPASEPASVSIARMYPDGVVPAEATHQDSLPVKIADPPGPAAAPRRRMSMRERLFWVGLAGFVVIGSVLSVAISPLRPVARWRNRIVSTSSAESLWLPFFSPYCG
jgi:hypothetical protein